MLSQTFGHFYIIGQYEIPMILSHHGFGNEIDDRIESRPGEIALKWEMGNEIDRVAK